MRTIKFRAWDKKQKKMSAVFDLKDLAHPHRVRADQFWDRQSDLEIMQYTEFVSSGSGEIFDRDIVEYEGKRYLVKITKFGVEPFESMEVSATHCKIIGNKFANPKLIK